MTEPECTDLILRLIGDAPDGMSEDELWRIVEWYQNTTADAAILHLFEESKVSLSWPEGGELTARLR